MFKSLIWTMRKSDTKEMGDSPRLPSWQVVEPGSFKITLFSVHILSLYHSPGSCQEKNKMGSGKMLNSRDIWRQLTTKANSQAQTTHLVLPRALSLPHTGDFFFFFLLGYMKFNSLGVFLINKHPVLRKNLALETLYKYQSFTIVCKLVPCMTFLWA